MRKKNELMRRRGWRAFPGLASLFEKPWLAPLAAILCFSLGAMLALDYWHSAIDSDLRLAEHHFHRDAREVLSRMESDVAAVQAIGRVLANSEHDGWGLAANLRVLDDSSTGRLGLPLEGLAMIRRSEDGRFRLDRWWPAGKSGVPIDAQDAGLQRLLDWVAAATTHDEEVLALGHSTAKGSCLGAVATRVPGGGAIVQVVDLDLWIRERVLIPGLRVAARLKDASNLDQQACSVQSIGFPERPRMLESASVAARSGIWVLDIAGQQTAVAHPSHLIVLLSGLTAAVALALLLNFVLAGRRSAEALIRHRTRDLEQVQARFERILRATRDGIWEFSGRTREVSLSAVALELLGLPEGRDCYPVRALLRRVVGADRPALFKGLRRTLEMGWVLDTECRIVDASGRLIWLRVRAVSEAWQGGNLSGAISDVTLQRRVTEQVERQQDFVARVLDAIPSPVVVRDGSGCVLLANTAYLTGVGLSRERLVGRRAEALETDDRAASQGRDGTVSGWITTPGFGRRHYRVSSVTRSGADGMPVQISCFLDTTAEIVAAEQSSRQHVALQRLIELLPVGLMVKDASRRIVLVNAAFCDMMGLKAEELFGRRSPDLLPAELGAEIEAEDDRIEAGELVECLRKFPNRQGRELTVRFRKSVSVDVDGSPVMVCVATDLSDLFEAQAAEREALARVDALYRHSPLGLILVDRRGRILQANHAFCALVGIDDGGCDEGDIRAYLNEDWLRERERADRSLLETGIVAPIEKRLVRADGVEVPVRASAALMTLANGDTLVWILVEDITAEVATRDMLQAISSMQEAFIQERTSPRSFDVVLRVLMRQTGSRFGFVGEVRDGEAGAELRTLALCDESWPEEAREACARALDEGAGRVRLDGVFGERVLEGSALIVEQPSGLSFEGLLPGGPELKNFLAVPVSQAGKVLGLLGVANADPGYSQASVAAIEALVSTFGEVLQARRNRLAREVAEAELKRHRDHLAELVAEQTAELMASRDAAEAANEAKTLFLANMSHELRTPLHAVLSFARLGQDRLGKVAQARTGEFFARIEQSADRLLGLLNDLLDLAKLQAAGIRLVIEPCDLAVLIDEVLAECEAWLAARRIEVVRDFAPLPLVPGDPGRLGQVIRNLVSNAIKFSPEGGRLRLSLASDGDAVELCVSDQGVGIPEGELEVVFNPFVQSSATRTGAGGTGLGLAICREIVSAHRGTICARNNPGGGADFVLRLPLSGAAEEEN